MKNTEVSESVLNQECAPADLPDLSTPPANYDEALEMIDGVISWLTKYNVQVASIGTQLCIIKYALLSVSDTESVTHEEAAELARNCHDAIEKMHQIVSHLQLEASAI